MSAGALLALTVAVLLLAGCGGESSDTSDSTAAVGDRPEESGSVSDPRSGYGGGGGAASVGNASEASEPSGDAGEESSPGAAADQPNAQSAEPPGYSPAQRRESTVASLALESPSSVPSGGGPPVLPAKYTCDGQGTSPALRWQGVPEGTAELVLFAMNIRPVEGKLFFDWALAGLSPELEEIEAGELPDGAVVGRNGFGNTAYEICPEGAGETYMFTLFALPTALEPARGFDPLALRKELVSVSGEVGLLALAYERD